jgi:hypothetical protein
MPTTSRKPAGSTPGILGLGAIVVSLVIGVIVVVAIFFRSGGFSVVAQSQGASIKIDFAESRIELSQILDQVLKEAESGTDAPSKKRLVASILQSHGFYQLPSAEAATALRGIEETDETRDFVRAVRATLYDLAGPFKRPATFLEAADDRLVLGIDDLVEQKPASPVIAKLWEMSLDMKGIFALRDVKIAVREDRNLKSGVAATCAGSILLGRVGLIRMGDDERLVGVHIDDQKPCGPTSPVDLLAEKQAQIWISEGDMTNLTGSAPSANGRDIPAILTPLPKNLNPEGLGSEDAHVSTTGRGPT